MKTRMLDWLVGGFGALLLVVAIIATNTPA